MDVLFCSRCICNPLVVEILLFSYRIRIPLQYLCRYTKLYEMNNINLDQFSNNYLVALINGMENACVKKWSLWHHLMKKRRSSSSSSFPSLLLKCIVVWQKEPSSSSFWILLRKELKSASTFKFFLETTAFKLSL